MFDAVGKYPPGTLRGNGQWLGNYKECVAVHDTQHGISGHYCPVAFGIQLAVCVFTGHHSCSRDFVNSLQCCK